MTRANASMTMMESSSESSCFSSLRVALSSLCVSLFACVSFVLPQHVHLVVTPAALRKGVLPSAHGREEASTLPKLCMCSCATCSAYGFFFLFLFSFSPSFGVQSSGKSALALPHLGQHHFTLSFASRRRSSSGQSSAPTAPSQVSAETQSAPQGLCARPTRLPHLWMVGAHGEAYLCVELEPPIGREEDDVGRLERVLRREEDPQ